MFPMKLASVGGVLVWAAFCCSPVECSAAGSIDSFGFPSQHMTLAGQSNATDDVEISPHQNGTNCECGLPRMLSTRIVGGERSSIVQYPWMAGIRVMGFIFCGGAIINDRYILSAAHCFKDDMVRSVAVASLGITYRDEVEVEYEVEEVIQHEMYNKTIKGRYDIALIKLSKPLKFTNKIRPVCLPLPSTNFNDLYATVTGWGVVKHGGEVSNELRAVPMRIMDYATCHQLYSYANHNSLCAGGVEGQDACQGDSGSPLFVDVDGAYRLAGVVSWGIGCAKKGYPGVFTNIQHYLPWIIDHTRDAECQQQGMNPGWNNAVNLTSTVIEDDPVILHTNNRNPVSQASLGNSVTIVTGKPASLILDGNVLNTTSSVVPVSFHVNATNGSTESTFASNLDVPQRPPIVADVGINAV